MLQREDGPMTGDRRLCVTGLSLAALLLWGVAFAGEAPAAPKKNDVITLCPKCGEVAKSEKCCKEGAAKCAGCSLNKGAPGCCALPKDAKEPVVLCKGCGQVKGSEKCCKPDAKKCAACGCAAGSPGCKAACAVTEKKYRWPERWRQ